MTSITYKQNGTTVIGNLTYEYDKAGNRTKTGGSWARTGVPEPVTSTSYDLGNRQLTFGDKTLAYDDNGNLQSITDSNGTTLYSWNARNQLVGISGPNVSASFVYDGMGRREAKTINGNLTEFLYDGVNPVQETAGATILANILPGLGIDEFLTRTDVVAGVTSNFLVDALGSPVAVADNAGAVQTEYTYEAFGKNTATGASNNSSYQYTGRENDGSGLYYYRSRYYHPILQRFVTEDPVDFGGGDVNFYVYVENNPLSFVDPLGLYGMDEFVNDAANASAGFGDAISLGGTDLIRDLMGTNSEVNKCSDAYRAGSWASFTLGAGRLAYAGLAKAASILASSGAAASAFRSQLRTAFGGGKTLRPPNLAKYATDDALRGAAGRTNPYANAYGAGVAAAGALGGRGCGCSQ